MPLLPLSGRPYWCPNRTGMFSDYEDLIPFKWRHLFEAAVDVSSQRP